MYFSRSRDMVGAYQNLNGSLDLITRLSGIVCHPCTIALATINRYTKFEVYLYPLLRYERRYKIAMTEWFGGS